MGEHRVPGIDDVVADAWQAFAHAAALPSRVSPAIPILFFGNLNAYRASPLRVLTTGLNPSLHEFPEGDPFQRFPLASTFTAGEPQRYLDALSAYFRVQPYRSWFNSFEPFLQGLWASYFERRPSTALHTDLCSPIATDPTWTGLGEEEHTALEADGGPLWHELLTVLQPHVVALSVAKHHLARIEFRPLTNWGVIHAFHRTGAGAPRRRPVEISARWYEVGGARSLFVFGPAAQLPLGMLNTAQRLEAGMIALEVWDRER